MHRLLKRLIIFLIRKRMGLKKGERFQFTNQASKWNTYYFDTDCVLKVHYNKDHEKITTPSTVSLNWLLNDHCEIVRCDKDGEC